MESKINIVSSFTRQGYERYGKDFIQSFKEYWPSDVDLTIYYEGEDCPADSGVLWESIHNVEFHDKFMSRLAFPIMRGKVGETYNINYDAGMARKAFIQMHSLKKFGTKTFWLDADTITFNQVPKEFIEDCLPDNFFNCYLGRDGWYYTESGFIGFNPKHQIANEFYKRYVNIFLSGLIFTLKGWHDCFGFDAVRKSFDEGLFNDLAKDLPRGTMHPFVNSKLGAYMDHRKGPRKESRSTDKDLVIERTEGYWTKTKQESGHK